MNYDVWIEVLIRFDEDKLFGWVLVGIWGVANWLKFNLSR